MKKIYTSISALILSAVSFAQAPYCDPVYTNGTNGHHFVHGVWMGNINNVFTGGDNGTYQDFTSMSSVLFSGQTHAISIIGSVWEGNSYAVYIDYNQDNDFNDLNEKVGEFSIDEPFETNSILIEVPEDALIGNTRMRIRNVFAEVNIDPCLEYAYGETEDYAVSIQNFVLPTTNNVWPADANNDGVANAWDILNMGIAFGMEGESRSTSSLNWEAQQASDWNESVLGVDAKFSDADGNGVVEFDDVHAIDINYNNEHDINIFNPLTVQGQGTVSSLTLIPRENSVLLAETMLVDIYAENLSDFYGAAFTIIMPADLIEENGISVDFSQSILGTLGEDLITVINYNNEGQLDIGISRNDLLMFSGGGLVGTVQIVIEDDVAGKGANDYNFEMAFANVTAIGNTGETIEFSPKGTTFGIDASNLSVNNQIDFDGSVFPNPTSSSFTVSCKQNMDVIEVLDISGRVVKIETSINSPSFNFNLDLENGVYFLRIFSGGKFGVKEITILN